MKSQPPAKENKQELEEDIEVKADGPLIAAAKKSKVAIIAASAILTLVVLYFFFFKGDSKPPENLQLVEPPKPSAVAQSEGGKSVFEFEEKTDKQKQEVETLEKPAVPEVPSLPSLPEGAASPDALNINNPAANQNLQQGAQPLPPIQPLPLLPGQEALVNNQQNPNALPGQNASGAGGAGVGGVGAPNSLPPEKPLDPRYAPIVIFAGGQGGPKQGVGYTNNIVRLNKNPLEDLQETQAGVVPTYIVDRPHTIAQGKLLTAVLETAINTEVPGFVRAIVARDVYGESGNEVLIPRGSRLYGSYSSQIQRGQGRVQINWTRLIRPDGVDLAIAFNASDQFGRSGIGGEVDNKYGAVVANSLLTSVIAVAATAAAQSLAGGDQNLTTTNNAAQGATTVTSNATNQAINNVTKSVVDTVARVVNDALDVNPIIRVPQGTRITVIVNSDIRVPYINGRKTR